MASMQYTSLVRPWQVTLVQTSPKSVRDHECHVKSPTPSSMVAGAVSCQAQHQLRMLEAAPEPANSCGAVPELGRRDVLSGVVGCAMVFLTPSYAEAGGLFDKYIKRKKLDPLETYLPTILLSQLQLQELEGRLVTGQPNYDEARSLLRSGPASSLRTDIRAVAQYAVDAGDGQTAVEAIDGCLRAIEELDSYLFRASRNDPPALDLMRQRVTKAVSSLDSLLSTVPAEILEKGKSVASYYRDIDNTPVEDTPNLSSDLLKALPKGL